MNDFTDEGLMGLSDGIRSLQNLEKLFLQIDFRKLEEVGFIYFSESLDFLPKLNNLKLNLDGEMVKARCIQELSKHLKHLQNLQILEIIFEQNHEFQKEVIIELSQSISQLKRLEELQLNEFLKKRDYESNIQFFDSVGQLENLKVFKVEVKFEHNQGVNLCTSLSNNIKQLNQLVQLDIFFGSNSNIGEEGAQSFSEALQNLTNLNTLRLTFDNGNKIRNYGAQQLGEALGKLTELQNFVLYIRDQNYIGIEGSSSIFDGLKKCVKMSKLDLSIENNKLTKYGVIKLGQALENLINLESLSINLVEDIREEGASAIGIGLSKLEKLNTFNFTLECKFCITQLGIRKFSQEFKQLQKLEKLCLSFYENSLRNCQGLLELSEGLSHLKNLKDLDITLYGESDVDSQSYIAFGKALQNLSQVTSLNIRMRGNNIQTDGFIGLGQGLKCLKQLETFCIDVFPNSIDHEGSDILIDIFQNLENLKELSLWLYQSQENVQYSAEIGNCIKYLKNLNTLWLFFGREIKIDYQGAVSLGKGLKELGNLKSLDIWIHLNQEIEEEGIKVLCSGLNTLQNLNTLKFRVYDDPGYCYDILYNFGQQKNLQKINVTLGSNLLYSMSSNDMSPVKYQDIYGENYSPQQNQQYQQQQMAQNNSHQLDQLSEIEIEDEKNGANNLENQFLTQLKIDLNKQKYPSNENQKDLLKQLYIFKNLNQLSIKFGKKFEISQCLATNIKNGLKNFDKLQELTINFSQENGFDFKNVAILSQGIKYLINLVSLKFQIGIKNSLDEKGMIYLAESFAKLQNLIRLNLTIKEGGIDAKGAIALGRSLSNMVNLNFLCLEIGQHNNIGQEGAQQIGKGLQYLSKIYHLDLRIGKGNQISSQGATAIGYGISQLSNLKELTLKIESNNNIQADGAVNLIANFNQLQDLSIFYLHLDPQNSISSSVIEQITNMFKKISCLETIEIYIFLQFIEHDYELQLSQLFKAMEMTNFSQKLASYKDQCSSKISFQKPNTNITTQLTLGYEMQNNPEYNLFDSVFLPVKAIKYLPQIKTVSSIISFSMVIGEYGAAKLAECLKQLTHIQELQIHFEYFNKIGKSLRDVAESISQLENLKILSLKIQEGNKVQIEDSIFVSQKLSFLKDLLHLTFLFNKQESLLFEDYRKIITNFSNMKSLRICYIGVSCDQNIDSKNKLQRILYKNRRLVSSKLSFSLDDLENQSDFG
ncbi:hypothetical protein ABPG74_017748 [Tetrahymena malaccensis]